MSFFKEEDYTYIEIPFKVWANDYIDIIEWLMVLPNDDYEYSSSRGANGTVYYGRDIYFRYKEDAIAFKLRFGI